MQGPTCARTTPHGAGLKAPSGYRVRWPRAGESIRGRFICRRPQACWTHFLRTGQGAGFTKPCIGRAFACEWCRTHALEMWIVAAYLDEQAGRVGLLKITVEAARGNDRFLDPRTDLRGFAFVYQRLGREKNGRCVLELVSSDGASSVRVREPNVFETLAHLWGMQPDLRPFDELAEGV